jgi:hypothetical protein
MNSRLALVLIGASASLGSAFGGQYSDNFNDGSAAPGLLTGNAVAIGNAVRLTQNEQAQMGSLIIPDLDPGLTALSFTATFDMAMGPAFSQPADGLSFVFGSLADSSTFGEAGVSSGLTVSFDLWDNGGGEGPGMNVIVNDSIVAGGHSAMNPYTNGAFVPVAISFFANGTLNLSFNGSTIFSGLNTGFTPQLGYRFGFGARTGALSAVHQVDNVNIQTQAVPEPASLMALGIGALGALWRRRRKH